jgi:hypothetical protein
MPVMRRIIVDFMPKKRLGVVLALLILFSLAACSSQNPAVTAVENYLTALVDKNEATFVALTCPDYETDALLEFDAFSLVETKLEGPDCSLIGEEDGTALVSCQGRIVATYGNEDQTFELAERIFIVEDLDGDWLICGD